MREVLRKLSSGPLAAIAKLMGVDVKVSNTYNKDHPFRDDGRQGEITFTAFGDSTTWDDYSTAEIVRAWDDPGKACQALEDAIEALPDEAKATLAKALPNGIVGWARSYWDEMQKWDEAIKTCPGVVIQQRSARINGKQSTETIMTTTDPDEELRRLWNL